MRSLVAEDDVTCRKVLKSMLTPYGQCTEVGNGREALEAFLFSVQNHQIPYQLICLDIFMPKKNGQDTLLEIRTLEESLKINPVKILMTTGGSFTNGKVEALKLQCDGYLTKPISQVTLLDHLKKLGLL